jgi:pimeloyl-ACP methyl ester carboxylesterase
VGHSFGGCVALQLALDAPDMVATLVLLEPALMIGASAASYRESLINSSQTYRESGAATVMEDFFRARWPGYTRAALEQAVPGAFDQALHDASTTFDLDIGLVEWEFGQAEARRIEQPALVVLGGGSEALHARFTETYRFLLDWLPRAEGLVLSGATHFFQLESPNTATKLAQALASFYARHPLEHGLTPGSLG